jgi:hypothetical protein
MLDHEGYFFNLTYLIMYIRLRDLPPVFRFRPGAAYAMHI